MKTTLAISARALAFLGEQRLPPCPRYYALGFAFCGKTHPELAKAIGAIIDDGVRITQAEADELHETFLGSAAQPVIPSSDNGSDALRHHTLRLGDLAASATAITGEFSRELAVQIGDVGAVDPVTFQELLVVTLERSQRTERELAATTAQVDQLRQKLEEAQGDAERDALTGLPNRRGIEAYLSRIDPDDPDQSVAICDIDRFKSYNDHYGHAVGDRVLKTVATSLAESLGGHFVGRWGGEEFLIVVQCNVESTVTMLEVAKEALGRRQFKLRETDEPMWRISFSAGVANLCGETRAKAIEMADAALYRAKETGRDKVLAA
ncbi:GGDEF domain-containing protein [Sphingomonas sp. CLY1604]|uniref:GGDEF domain-containing protein n=1 Tax=Sphingomonas sp. CLY1604 TaxID=3457786 RepID=UPI003FD8717D